MQAAGSSTVKSQSGFFPIIPQLTADLYLGASACIHSKGSQYQIHFLNKIKNKPKKKKALKEVIS